MLFKDFRYQNKETKKRLLFENGAYLTCRKQDETLIVLFQVSHFYVEVYFDEKEEIIGFIHAFEQVEFLEPYLAQIDITGLVNASMHSS